MKILSILLKSTRLGPERRIERRLLCSNLVQVSWLGTSGRRCTETGVLENLSRSGFGICVFIATPMKHGTELSILANNSRLTGRVVQSNARESGYVVGLRLDEPCAWADGFEPEHLTDVMTLDLN